ncbi:hypothetical protein RchiOBHm_Chr2g0153781 [Rosa chinensis]|uniref:Uncharacterized protein n=1 Tax=Rosa chinensis TaxID=74649 RepID=A0A2P6S0S2_ROSCH|nr:hypothetical protein RchiOBHm_Chr2g0153781 [Rosa chinensis]
MNDHISLNAREIFSAVLERPWLFSKGYWLFMNSPPLLEANQLILCQRRQEQHDAAYT